MTYDTDDPDDESPRSTEDIRRELMDDLATADMFAGVALRRTDDGTEVTSARACREDADIGETTEMLVVIDQELEKLQTDDAEGTILAAVLSEMFDDAVDNTDDPFSTDHSDDDEWTTIDLNDVGGDT